MRRIKEKPPTPQILTSFTLANRCNYCSHSKENGGWIFGWRIFGERIFGERIFGERIFGVQVFEDIKLIFFVK
jgi:hypothetical protein